MSLHDHLLEQAGLVVGLDQRRPRQATLRRAVSTAYYALFHLLVHEVSAKFHPDGPLRLLTRRTLDHREMKTVAEHFRDPLKRSRESVMVYPGSIPPELSLVAETFVQLYDERIRADYNVDATFRKSDVRQIIGKAEKALAAWRSIRATPAAEAFLSSLLLWKRWRFN